MLNLTDFNWVLEARFPDQLQLKLYTAPHMARALVGVLPRTWGARVQNGRCVRVRRGSAILSFFRALGQHPHLTAALRAYVATYRGRGSRTHAMRCAAVKEVLRFLTEGPESTSPNALADTTASVPECARATPLPGGSAVPHGPAQSTPTQGVGSTGQGQA